MPTYKVTPYKKRPPRTSLSGQFPASQTQKGQQVRGEGAGFLEDTESDRGKLGNPRQSHWLMRAGQAQPGAPAKGESSGRCLERPSAEHSVTRRLGRDPRKDE